MTRIWKVLQNTGNEEADPVALPQPIAMRYDAHAEEEIDEEYFRQILTEQAEATSKTRIVFHTDPGNPAADKFRLLRIRLRTLWSTEKLRTLLITSPLPEDGKTTVTLNLAMALCNHSQRRILVVDADLHRRRLRDQLGLPPAIGLRECLEYGLDPTTTIRRIEPFGWYLLGAGTEGDRNPTELLRPEVLTELFQKLSHHFSWILVDSPPVLALADAVVLAHALDRSLMVVRAQRTPRKAVEDSLAALGRNHVAGIVLNGVEGRDEKYAAYHGYYRQQASGK